MPLDPPRACSLPGSRGLHVRSAVILHSATLTAEVCRGMCTPMVVIAVTLCGDGHIFAVRRVVHLRRTSMVRLSLGCSVWRLSTLSRRVWTISPAFTSCKKSLDDADRASRPAHDQSSEVSPTCQGGAGGQWLLDRGVTQRGRWGGRSSCTADRHTHSPGSLPYSGALLCRCQAGLHSTQRACSAKQPPPCMEEVPEPCTGGAHIVYRRCNGHAAPRCQVTVHSYCEGFASIAGVEPQRHLVPHRCFAKPPQCGHCQQLKRSHAAKIRLDADMAKCGLPRAQLPAACVATCTGDSDLFKSCYKWFCSCQKSCCICRLRSVTERCGCIVEKVGISCGQDPCTQSTPIPSLDHQFDNPSLLPDLACRTPTCTLYTARYQWRCRKQHRLQEVAMAEARLADTAEVKQITDKMRAAAGVAPCTACMTEVCVLEGVRCSAKDKHHFMCDDCFDGWVLSESVPAAEHAPKEAGEVWCMCKQKKGSDAGCPSASPFSPQVLSLYMRLHKSGSTCSHWLEVSAQMTRHSRSWMNDTC